ncbi:ABC transporter ATP-binding protein [Zavarzinia sp. CC-PAN008]|uniref:ABC transporter ATP-binding protein n=1 Tax=Zavarzinia sp. CC-PAN008 TaxID=3243332 RepID=UPI003F748631
MTEETREPPAIRVDRLVKTFGPVAAVNGISFRVEPGTITALLGGNGAGKTTTIAMILGLILPTSGGIEVLGEDMLRHKPRVLPRMNFSSPYVDVPHRLTVAQNLKVYASLYGMRDVTQRVRQLAADLDLTHLLDRPAGRLSAGQKTRVALAKSLINEPDLLLLDEPTASLDPDTADWVRSYLEAYRARRGATILLASHNMAEVERMCDAVLVMKQGTVVDQGTPGELLARYGRADLEEVFLDIARDRRRDDADAPRAAGGGRP